MSAALEMVANMPPPVPPAQAPSRPDAAVRDRSSVEIDSSEPAPDASAIRARKVSMASEETAPDVDLRLPQGKPDSIDLYV